MRVDRKSVGPTETPPKLLRWSKKEQQYGTTPSVAHYIRKIMVYSISHIA